jgi:hypothetical protein
MGNGFSSISESRGSRYIPVIVWRKSVHAATANKGSLAVREAEIGEEVCGWDGYSCIVGGGGSSMR